MGFSPSLLPGAPDGVKCYKAHTKFRVFVLTRNLFPTQGEVHKLTVDNSVVHAIRYSLRFFGASWTCVLTRCHDTRRDTDLAAGLERNAFLQLSLEKKKKKKKKCLRFYPPLKKKKKKKKK